MFLFRLPTSLRRKWCGKSKFKLFRIIGYMHYRMDLIIENFYIKNSKLPTVGINVEERRNEKIVVSLTSFPERMPQTYYAVKSLMLQSYKADRIVLWLSELQFPDKKLPSKFKALIAAGLTVKFTEDDLRSHKKYYYALQQQQADEVVLTFDDDIIYEPKAIERLVATHLKFPNSVVCEYGNEITLEYGDIMPYSDWIVDSEVGHLQPDLRIMPYTGAGCLYPYNIMPKSAFDKKMLTENAITADDLWMKFNSLNAGVKVVKTRKTGPMLCVVKGSQIQHLGEVNNIGGENDRTIKRLASLFPMAVVNLKKLQ